MRFHEIQNGLRIAVSLEETALMELIGSREGQFIKRQDLDERQMELARKMVSRGVLDRVQREGSLYYVVNGLEDLWRNQ